MHLDSVRELKQDLPAHLERTFISREWAARASLAVATAADRRRTAPGYFLGVAARDGRDYRLAVRLQDHALEHSALIREIRARARGEVDVRYVGKIRARAPWYRSRQRPLRAGASVGFLGEGLMAGTLGAFVRRRDDDGAVYLLSNNHVLADENRRRRGAPIVQPGTLDGGRDGRDRVAGVASFVRLERERLNRVDGAIAKLRPEIEIEPAAMRGIGTLAGSRARRLDLGDGVHKVGRTTGVTHGRVTAIELDGVTVEYDRGILVFDDQIEIEGAGERSFSAPGDSGALIADDDIRAAALLFAGSDHGGKNGKGLTYANSIHRVLGALGVRLIH